MGDGMLIGAVVVHRPDLLVAAGYLDVIDLGLGDAGGTAAEPEDDLIGEAVGDLASGVLRGRLVVLLGEHLGILGILGVEEVAVADDSAALDAEAAEGDHGRRYRSRGPLLEIDLRGRAGGGLRLEAL